MNTESHDTEDYGTIRHMTDALAGTSAYLLYLHHLQRVTLKEVYHTLN